VSLKARAGVGEILVGLSTVVAPLAAYSTYVNSIPILDVRIAQQLEYLAYSVILLTLIGISLGLFGLQRFLSTFRSSDSADRRMLRVIARIFERERYRRIMFAVTLIYAVVFAILSGMIVYSPLENFAGEYLVRVPSAIVAVCCGDVGFIPVLTVFVTNHLGLLLIPADILILVVVSGLVGLNATLIVCQYDSRPRSPSRRWLLGVGAACGLFSACPTCAGLFLSTLVLGLGPSVLVLLSGLQFLFVMGTVFALVLGVGLSARVIATQAPPQADVPRNFPCKPIIIKRHQN